MFDILTHCGRDKMASISQTTFSDGFSYMLSCEYRVLRNQYLHLLFTSEDRLCANLRMQEQSTNMTSQCQYPTLAWCHRSTVVTSQCNAKSEKTILSDNYEIRVIFSRIVCSGYSCIIPYFLNENGFLFKFHWSLFLGIQLAIFQHRFR